MKAFRSRAAAALCLAGLALAFPAAAQQEAEPAQPDAAQPAPPDAAQPKEVLKATYGAWEIHCLEGTDKCAMQQIGKTAEGKTALQVSVERLAGVTAEGKPVPAAMTVRTPLGVLIPYMVRVRVDDGEVQQMPLMRCAGDSCIARAPLSEQAVEILKKGSTARFGFYLNSEILVDVSLNGFTKAYGELTPIEAQAQN